MIVIERKHLRTCPQGSIMLNDTQGFPDRHLEFAHEDHNSSAILSLIGFFVVYRIGFEGTPDGSYLDSH